MTFPTIRWPGWLVSMTFFQLMSKTRVSPRYTSSGEVATRDDLRGRRKRMIGRGARTGSSGISRRPTWIHAESRFLGSRKMESPPEDEAMMTRCVPFQMPRYHASRRYPQGAWPGHFGAELYPASGSVPDPSRSDSRTANRNRFPEAPDWCRYLEAIVLIIEGGHELRAVSADGRRGLGGPWVRC